MKDWVKILRVVNVLLVLVIVIIGYQVYQQKVKEWEKERIATVISHEEKAMTANQKVSIQAGMIDQTYVLAAYPIGKDKEPLPAVTQEMQALIAEYYGSSSEKSSKIKQLAFVDSKVSPSELATVAQYKLQSREYANNPKEVTLKKTIEGKELYVKEDGQLFLITDLVSDTAFFINKWVGFMEKQLSDEGKLDETAKTQLGELKNIDLKTLSFVPKSDALDIHLPQKISGTEVCYLPLKELYDHLDSKYLQGDALNAYRTYQEEKARLEKERALAMAQGHPQVVLPGKVVALTFDDGPNPSSTTRILDTLKQYNAKATFFVLGNSVVGNEAILKREVAEGHEVGNHTWSHPSLPSLSVNDIKWQMEETTKVITAAIGKPVKFMRPPYGATNATVQATVGYPQILWDVDTLDWKNRNTQAILANIQSQVRPGAVILMHDIHGTTADALPTILDYLVNQGYQFVTLSELYGV
ncbi:polysaccharide deacetylase family protein [Streptococcus sp. S784/96/1]|uniref:polysaccharide deacetylase family protein n=1 Tax=Streptococcus sp. S784/96/1 TaxID=2653499 RepID=UPI001389D8DC|nr:polysaccharide deacetylase family protein [Streptococcus sp. S784/96/1]